MVSNSCLFCFQRFRIDQTLIFLFQKSGGLGSAFDELELNRILCQHYNVRVAGVIINKVIPEKLEQTAHYMRKGIDMPVFSDPLAK